MARTRDAPPVGLPPAPWALEPDAALATLASSPGGLTDDEAARRFATYGPNVVPGAPGSNLLRLLGGQFRSPLIAILLVAGAVTIVVGEYVDAAVIAAVLVFNAAVGFLQEYRAERSITQLQRLAHTMASVRREGRERDVDARTLVPGDVIRVDAGMRVPADARVLDAHGAEADESVLTGESTPVPKGAVAVTATTPTADRTSMLHTGTALTRGRAHAVVVATGRDTELGRVSVSLGAIGRVETPLQRRMEGLANAIAVVVLVFGAAVLAIGLALGGDLQQLFLTLITLAVSAIPEGLPITLTVALAVSVARMARRHVIIRKLPAAETLGSCTVIGSDKTGTLTENRMTVRLISAGGVAYRVEGPADTLAGGVRDAAGAPVDLATAGVLAALLEAAVLATHASLELAGASDDCDEPGPAPAIAGTGDPLEIALLVAAARAGVDVEPLSRRYPRWGELPFDAEQRYTATFCAHDGRDFVFVNGAPETVLARSTRAAGCAALDRVALAAEATRLAEQGQRVIGVARRDLGPAGAATEDHEALRDLEFLGFFGMLDPPREEAREALAGCARAGIRVVMITGDHATTAAAIARDLGIGGPHPATLAGAELERMDDAALVDAVGRTDVYARVTPDDKLRIVRALQARGDVVAVTGDGVNDAAALKAADVGVAMGRSGTDVAKEAAELVITDDNFASVYAAVEEGRFAFQNVRNATFFLISSGVAEVVAVVSSILFGFHPPFAPVQILWLNLVTDSVQGIGLAFEPGDPALMRAPPRPRGEGLLSRLLTERLVVAGGWMGAATLALFLWQLDRAGATLAQAQTVALTTMVLFQVLHVFNARSERRSAFATSPLTNRFLLGGSLAVLVLHVAALYLPFTQYVLRFEPPTPAQWLLMVATSLTVVAVVEAHKRLRG